MKEKYYITTPIYYPSGKLHIGHSYCSVCTDALARFKRLEGHDVFFLTGTDEHGQKIERTARAVNREPKEYVDEIVDGIKDLWKLMDISYDDFIRTTEDRHKKSVQVIFQKLYDQGDIYKGSYKGWYCAPCEAFFLERQLKDGNCPDCERPVELVEEESYFFKLSKYQDRLMQYIEDHPEFIQPVSRKTEMVESFLKPGLEDLSVSRTSFSWGVSVPFDPKHVIYVWVDALSNYITALGAYSSDESAFEHYWPADVHIVGKEIVRFHTIIWPILLMALGLPLPKQVFGHGWLVLEGSKMSKSKGNVIDPVALCERYSADAIRYFLLREMPFGADGVFSNAALIARINSDLANDLGNLLSRTVTMIDKYCDSILPNSPAPDETDAALRAQGTALHAKVKEAVDALKLPDALSEIWRFISACNKYIDVTMPWILAKNNETERLNGVLYNLAEGLRIVAVLLTPFMPATAPKMFEQLGVDEAELKTLESIRTFGALKPGTKVKRGEALFPRIDAEKELLALSALNPAAQEETKQEESAQKSEYITIEDFAKLDLRLAKVTACEPLEGSDKLLKLTLKVGAETRTVVSGIRKWYTPEDLRGKTVVLLANLKPAKLRGVLSEGMILAASDDADEELSVLTTLGELPDGYKVR